MIQLFKWIYDHIADLLLWLFSKISGLGLAVLDGLKEGMGTLVPAENMHLIDDSLAAINHFFPLSETVGFATTLFGVWVLCLLYRLVKSWIPTVSGT